MACRRCGRAKSKFQPCEDLSLLEIVHGIGIPNWAEIAEQFPGRNARQCRERWTNYVNLSLVKQEWTEAEDEILRQSYQDMGPKWFIIARSLPGRSRNSVKNRYFLLQHRELNERGFRFNNPPDQPNALTIPSREIQEVQHNGIDPFAFLDAFQEQDAFEWGTSDLPDLFLDIIP
jgi:hypothetical protein